jgi:hypothetical protein
VLAKALAASEQAFRGNRRRYKKEEEDNNEDSLEIKGPKFSFSSRKGIWAITF